MKKPAILDVSVVTPTEVVFEGQAHHLIVPGEQGVFEICPFHKSIVSRLFPGIIFLDEQRIPIHHGVVKVHRNKVTVLIAKDIGKAKAHAA